MTQFNFNNTENESISANLMKRQVDFLIIEGKGVRCYSMELHTFHWHLYTTCNEKGKSYRSTRVIY